MTAHLIANAIIFFLLAMIWSSKTWLNLGIKCVFVVMSGWNGFLLAQALGYIIKI